MTEVERSLAAARLRTALELADLAAEMVEMRACREHPGATPDQIRTVVRSWYADRPGAEHGDGEGEPIPWPRP